MPRRTTLPSWASLQVVVSAVFALTGCQRDIAPSRSGAASLPKVEAPVASNVAPRITSAFQTTRTLVPGRSARLNVRAMDPEGTALRYDWEAPEVGTLGKPTALVDGSETRWTAPACSDAPETPVVRVRVTDAEGLETLQTFAMSWTGPACAPPSRTRNGSVQLALGSNPDT
ncbi:MAG: hypothetical protein EOO71_14610 [Myxococcaceae bacterium]|nr:MAG: hypothetical protein EOO71_14610 [Myxococcaceae bacterium]